MSLTRFVTIAIVLAVLGVLFAHSSWFEPSRGPRRHGSLNNLHNLGIAVANHVANDPDGALPRGTLRSAAGDPLHGWPAQLLVGLDASAIHRSIDFDVPWDDPVNVELMKREVPVFVVPGQRGVDPRTGYGLVHYAMNSRVIGDHAPLAIDGISDGVSSTLLGGEVGGGFRPWGHPDNSRDPSRGFGSGAGQFGSVGANDFVPMLFTDGAARGLNRDISPKVLRALATPNGGETLPPGSY